MTDQITDPEERLDDDAAEVEEEIPDPSESPLDALRRQRQQIGEAKEVTLDIPGYDGKLAARYRKMDYDELREISRRFQKSKHPDKLLRLQCATIAAACVELLIRKDGVLEPMSNGFSPDGQPIRFDRRAGDVLGFEAESGIGAVLGVFNNDVAIPGHYDELTEWFEEGSAEEDADFQKT